MTQEDVNSYYTSLRSNIEENEENYITGKSGENLVSQTLDEANRLLDQAHNTQEMKSDAMLMFKLSDLTLKRVRTSGTSSDLGGVRVEEFMSKIKSILGNDSESETNTLPAENSNEGLAKIGKLACLYLNVAPAVDFMMGPIALERKVTTARRAGQRLRINEATDINPEALDADDMKQTEEKTSKLITEIFRDVCAVYERNGRVPISLFRLIINPESFSQSVENMFYTSFLVRDGRLSLNLDENKLPIVEPLSEESSSGHSSSGPSVDTPSKQVIIDLDIPTWQELISLLDITEPLIATRESTI